MSNAIPFATEIALVCHVPVEEAMSTAAEAGCTLFYLDLNHEGDELATWSAARVKSLTTLSRRVSVRPIVHGSIASGLACELDEHRCRGVDRTMGEVELARMLGTSLILHPSSYYPGRVDPLRRDVATRALATSMRELVGRSAGSGVDLWLENLPRVHEFPVYDSTFASPDEIRQTLDACGQISAVIDVGHANLGVGAGEPAPFFGDISGRIAVLCFSDNDGRRDEHRPLGQGGIDFGSIVEQIIRARWTGVVAFETIGSNHSHDVDVLRREFEARSGQE